MAWLLPAAAEFGRSENLPDVVKLLCHDPVVAAKLHLVAPCHDPVVVYVTPGPMRMVITGRPSG
jgi:hypothetical protein